MKNQDFQHRLCKETQPGCVQGLRLLLAAGHMIAQHAEQVEIKMKQDKDGHMVFVASVIAIEWCRPSVMTGFGFGASLRLRSAPLRLDRESKGFSAASLVILNLLSSEP